ncbi:MAG: YerC/YecD family TrpR-related protein [Christensenellales bacterium]|jgi:TrpR-related protein YerC/YecD
MDYQPIIKNEEIDQLYTAVLNLHNLEECYRFFEDLCTIQEVQSMAQRLEVARLLQSGVTYQEIVRRTGASTSTISRINRCLLYGAKGYITQLSRLKEIEKE